MSNSHVIDIRFDPLVRQWTMRYEVKHNYLGGKILEISLIALTLAM